MIIAEIALEIVIQAEAETPLDVRGEDHLAFRMQGIPGTGTEIEPAVVAYRGLRLHFYPVRTELVGTLVRVVEHRIIEIPVELQEGVRDRHPDFLLLHFHQFALVVIGHLDRRIEVLGGCSRTGKQYRSECNIASHRGLHQL